MMPSPFVRALVALFVIVAPLVTHAAGELDPTFGNSGTVELVDTPGKGYAAARDAQGNLFVAGVVGGFGAQEFSVVKIDAFGHPAQSFGTNGRATIDLGGDDVAYSVAIDAGGNVFLGGVTKIGTASGFDFAVVKLDAAGHRAASFGDNGVAIVDFGPGNNDYGQSVRVLPSGGIYLVGATNHSSTDVRYDFAVMRLDAAGHLDASFGSGGRAQYAVGCCDDYGYGAVSDANGNLYVSGTTFTNTPGVSAIGVIKVRPNGSLDDTFGVDGVATASVLDTNLGYALARAPDGSLYVIGQVSSLGGPPRFGVAAFDAAGDPAAFGDGGVRLVDFGSGGNEFPAGIAVDADKNVHVCGAVDVDGVWRYAAAALDTGGSLRPSFGNGGTLVLDVPELDAFAYAALLEPSGGLFLAGASHQALSRDAGDAGATPVGNGPNAAVVKLRVDRAGLVLVSGFDTP